MTVQARPSEGPPPLLHDGLSDVRALGRMLMGAPPSPGLDWQAALALARRYGLSPLLYFRLFERRSIETGEEEELCVPEDVVEFLRDAIAQAKPLGLSGAKRTGGSLWAA
jgi:hypothetical protein